MGERWHTDADLTGAGSFIDTGTLNLGFSFRTGVPGSVNSIIFRSHAAPVTGSQYIGGLYQPTSSDPPAASGSGTHLATGNFPLPLVGDAWNVAPLTPVAISDFTPYRAVTFLPADARYRAKAGVFSTADLFRGNLQALTDGLPYGGFDLRNGTYQVSGALTYTKDSTGTGTSYFVDVDFTPDYYRLAPFRTPQLGPQAAGRYAFGFDVTSAVPIRFLGIYWYHPPGGTKGNVDGLLAATGSPGSTLATGSATGASLVDGWNYIPFSAPYIGSALTSFTPYVDLVGNGDHAYDNSVTLPQTDASGNVTMSHTRYESGGGFPNTVWDSGWHGVSFRYDFNTGPAPSIVRERWGMFI